MSLLKNYPTSKLAKSLSGDDAAALALQGLAFLAGDSARFSRFQNLTGWQDGSIQEAAVQPAFQAAVLDYLMADESLLLVFCSEAGIAPETVPLAARSLAG